MNKEKAKVLLERKTQEFKSFSYFFYADWIDKGHIEVLQISQDGADYQIEVNAYWDAGNQRDIRVVCSIDDGKLLDVFPVTCSFLIQRDNTIID